MKTSLSLQQLKKLLTDTHVESSDEISFDEHSVWYDEYGKTRHRRYVVNAQLDTADCTLTLRAKDVPSKFGDRESINYSTHASQHLVFPRNWHTTLTQLIQP